MLFEIDVSGMLTAWSRSVSVLKNRITRSAEVAAQEGAEEAKRFGAFKDRTGETRRRTRGTPLIRSQWIGIAWLECAVPHAIYLENGTKPHEIRPKAGYGSMGPLRRGQSRRESTDIGTHRKALRYVINGKVIFSAVVHHPGTKAYGFMGAGAQKAERVLMREAELAARDAEEAFHRS